MKNKIMIVFNKLIKAFFWMPPLTLIFFGIVLTFFAQFALLKFQNSLSPLAVEIIGAFIIILIIDLYFTRIWIKADYPETKTKIYNRLIGSLKNLSRDIVFNYFNLYRNASDIIHDSKKLKQVLVAYNEDSRIQIETLYLALSQDNINIWFNKINGYRKVLDDFIELAPLLRPKDKDLSSVLEIKRRIISIQEELLKSVPIRTNNKKFFSSDIYFLVISIIETIDSGLFDSILFSNAELSIIERTN